MNRTVVFVVAISLLLLSATGCPQTDEPPSEASATQPARAQPSEVTLTMEARYLTDDAESNRVIFSPDSDLRRASYEHYYFERQAFLAIFGGVMPTESVEVVVRIKSTFSAQNVPSDPHLSAPVGGFGETNHSAEVISIVSGNQGQVQQPEEQGARPVEQRRQEGISGRFDDFNLTPGFEPDPVGADGEAGGPRDASSLGKDCQGKIAAEGSPDHVITLTEDFDYLRLRVFSQPRTSLVILDSAGNSTCVEDQQSLESAFRAGVYQVFVANLEERGNPAYLLEITEFRPEKY